MRLLLILIVLLAACAPATTATPAAPTSIPGKEPTVPASEAEDELIRVDIPRIEEPDVDLSMLMSAVEGNNAFAFKLYQAQASQSTDNLIFSPYSISLALSMVYAGARGETESQMADVLHYLPQEGQHPASNALQSRTAALGEGNEVDENGDPFQLNIANAAWGQRDYPVLQPYLETLARHYGAGLRAVDFAADPDAARQRINDWIAEETADRIQNMVPPNVIDADTRLVLANAIYFQASWLFPFDPVATEEGPFHLLDGSEVTVPLMHQSRARIPYMTGDGFQAAILPYSGGTVGLVVILPDSDRFAEIEGRLSPEFLNLVRDKAATRDVTLTMPSLDFETDLPLGERLQEMGMTNAFSPAEADFSGIVEGGGLFISAALHKANITVDEKGTEAAAATVVEMTESAMERAEMTLDRPFILAIADNDVGTVLFLGRVLNPAE